VTARSGTVARVFTGVLAFQLVIAGLLILGDSRSDTPMGLPGLGPSAPRLGEPVTPGDQRRTYRPRRDRPTVVPDRVPGKMPDRLTLLREDDGTYRLEGTIDAGDAPRVIDLLADADPAPETLVLQSPGGSVRDALALGRHLRHAGIGTRVLRGEICFSACPYLLVGGATRDIDPDASVGLHQHDFGESVLLPAAFAVEDIQRGQAEVMGFLIEMGIDPAVMQHAMATPPSEIYVLLPDQLDAYGFTAPPDDAQ
jgi:hypothetical protein